MATQIFNSMPITTFVIFLLTFAGAFAGEFYREVNDKKKLKPVKFLASFFASWMIGFASTLAIQSFAQINNYELIMAISLFIGFIGHKDSIFYIRNFLNDLLKKKDG